MQSPLNTALAYEQALCNALATEYINTKTSNEALLEERQTLKTSVLRFIQEKNNLIELNATFKNQLDYSNEQRKRWHNAAYSLSQTEVVLNEIIRKQNAIIESLQAKLAEAERDGFDPDTIYKAVDFDFNLSVVFHHRWIYILEQLSLTLDDAYQDLAPAQRTHEVKANINNLKKLFWSILKQTEPQGDY